jgi:hypothetical protein
MTYAMNVCDQEDVSDCSTYKSVGIIIKQNKIFTLICFDFFIIQEKYKFLI